jgi:hypothetical protein
MRCIIAAVVGIYLIASSVFAQVTFIESSELLNIYDLDFSSGPSIIDYDNDNENEIFIFNSYGDHRLYDYGDDGYIDIGNQMGLNDFNDIHQNVTIGDVNYDYRPDFFVTTSVLSSTARLFINNYPEPFTDEAIDYNAHVLTDFSAAFFQMTRTSGFCLLSGQRLLQLSYGYFNDITLGSGLENIHNVFCPVFFDIDNDYDDDLFIAGNWELNAGALFRNNGDGTFTDISDNTNYDGFGYGQEVTYGDIDNDGDFDLYLCNGYGTNNMWLNDGTGYFTNFTAESNTGCGGYSRAISFADFDNDGDVDLFVNRSSAPKMLYLNDGTGVFTDYSIEAGVYLIGGGFGCSVGDLDDDGQIDIVAANSDYEPNFIFINQNDNPSYVKIRVHGRAPNTLAIGAIVELYECSADNKLYKFISKREISSHSTMHSVNDPIVHFGTGDIEAFGVRVYFQSGAIADTSVFYPGQTVDVIEPLVVGIEDPQLPEKPFILKAYPNPFNNSTIVQLNGGDSDYEISIYDVLGRIIRNTKVNNNISGSASFTWDGMDNGGLPVQSGLYFIKAHSGNFVQEIKVTLLK